MPQEPSTIDQASGWDGSRTSAPPERAALMIAWCAEEPARVGETALFETEGLARILGRGETPGEESGRVRFASRSPLGRPVFAALRGAGLSREQLRVTPRHGKLHVEQLGRCPLLLDGERVERCTLAPGDSVLLKGQLLLLCVLRPAGPPPLRDFPTAALGPFGAPDTFGILGESPTVYRLRDALAFQAKADAHVLVLGPSGSGKELVARGLHALSPRARGPFVARSAATLPVGLLEAELFGNVKNYPNPGMPERPGLVGAAEGGTLFLDEMGDLPPSLHASLLRLLDKDGEYHRLGEAKARRADIRLVGATNRPAESLKHDLLARLPLRLVVPGLAERRDDIPLLIRHLLRGAFSRTPELVARFVGVDGEPRVAPALVERLLRRVYETNVRELDGLLWRAMGESAGDRIELPTGLEAGDETRGAPPGGERSEAPSSPRPEPTADELRARITEHGGNLVQAARALGLPSRYALYRLLRKHGVDVGALRGEGD